MTKTVRGTESPASILYDSDLIIREASILASLAIFYDRVLLPWMPADGVNKFVRLRKGAARDGSAYFDLDMVEGEGLGDFHVEWDRQARTLYEAGVLERLPSPGARTFHFESVDDIASILRGIGANISIGDDDSGWFIKGYYAARVFHRIRDDVRVPRLYDMKKRRSDLNSASFLRQRPYSPTFFRASMRSVRNKY